MKKRMIAIITTIMLTAVPVYADKIDDQIEKLESQIAILQNKVDELKKQKYGTTEEVVIEPKDNTHFKDANCELQFLRAEVINDYNRLVAVIYFDFKSLASNPQQPSYAVGISAYQNGVELRDNTLYEAEIPEYRIAHGSILPGTETTIATVYVINDMSDLTVIINSRDYNNKEQSQFTVSLI